MAGLSMAASYHILLFSKLNWSLRLVQRTWPRANDRPASQSLDDKVVRGSLRGMSVEYQTSLSLIAFL